MYNAQGKAIHKDGAWQDVNSARASTYVRGLDFRVISKNELELHQQLQNISNACVARIKWDIKICKGCCCTLPDGTQVTSNMPGLVKNMTLKSGFVNLGTVDQ